MCPLVDFADSYWRNVMHRDVEGYGVVSEGETYHPTAFLDPAEKFKYAGDPQLQAEYQESKDAEVPALEFTDEQSNADLATSTVKINEPLTGDQTSTEIETKKPEVDVTPEGEPNLLAEGPTGVVIEVPVEEVSAESDSSVNFE